MEHLLKQLQAGDRAAFRQLAEAYQHKVVSTCYRYLGNLADAEDAAQEVFVEVFRSASRFRGESSLSTWIFRIAVNKSLDALKAKKRARRSSLLTVFMGSSTEHKRLEAPVQEQPDANYEQHRRREMLQQALDALPERQRSAIALVALEGFSYGEAAEILGVTPAAVEGLLHRGKTALKTLLHELTDERR